MVAFPAAIWIADLLMLFIVAHGTFRSEKDSQGYDLDPRTTKSQVGGTFAAIIFMGIAWLIGVFALENGHLVLEIIFAVANILQALLLFIFRCLLYYEAKAAWTQLCTEGTFMQPRGSPLSSGSLETPLARGRHRHQSREVFSANPVITNTNVNVWHAGDDEPQRTRSGNRVVSLKYGKQNVSFTDPVDAAASDSSGSLSSRRRSDRYTFEQDPPITEL